jgi:hypothetical protein
MKWEHIFAIVENGIVMRHDSIPEGTAPSGRAFPMSVVQYISELGANDGYEFAGSYPKDAGVVIVMKRQRAQL